MRRHIGRGSKRPYTWRRRARLTRKFGNTSRPTIPIDIMRKPSVWDTLVGGPTMKAYGRDISTDPTARCYILYFREPFTIGGARCVVPLHPGIRLAFLRRSKKRR